MDLMRPSSEDEVKQLVDTYSADEPEVLRHDFECSLHAAYRPDEIREQLERAGLEHLTVHVNSDRHFVVYGHR